MKEYKLKINGEIDFIIISPQVFSSLISQIHNSPEREVAVNIEDIMPPGFTDYLLRVADHAKLPTESSAMEPAPPKASEPEPPTEPMATQPQEPESPAEEEPTEPAFDIQTWIDYAKAYAESIGLRMESSAVDCWDNPISVGTHCSYLERDIQSRLNRYARDEDITDVWIWAEARSDGKYDLYIGYA